MVIRLKQLCSAAMFLVAATLASSGSYAQAPDGSSAVPKEQAEVVVTTSCGTQFASRLVTQNALASTNSTIFRNLTSTTFAVPSGSARCIKVLFTAEAACAGSANPDFCYVRALINGVEMFPQGGGVQALQSEDSSSAGHAFEWIRRVGPGTYTITIPMAHGQFSNDVFH